MSDSTIRLNLPNKNNTHSENSFKSFDTFLRNNLYKLLLDDVDSEIKELEDRFEKL